MVDSMSIQSPWTVDNKTAKVTEGQNHGHILKGQMYTVVLTQICLLTRTLFHMPSL